MFQVLYWDLGCNPEQDIRCLPLRSLGLKQEIDNENHLETRRRTLEQSMHKGQCEHKGGGIRAMLSWGNDQR